ncbi:hypothetical protein JW935_27925, partial [candidate division KSB1 bacterium]|nr:hypothetical protein [candidate division KSB1 bacterium]
PAGVPNTILFDYKAKTAEETLSLYILKTANSTLEMGHIELAKKFYAAGNVEKALDEYKALIYTIPTLDIFYEPVIKVLVEKEQYERAMAILFDALKFQRSAYVYKWIGQIYLVNNFTEKGIAFLEASDKLESKDPDVLFNLTRAFYKLSQFSKGDSYLERLKKLGAGSQAIQTLQEFKLSVQNAANEQ